MSFQCFVLTALCSKAKQLRIVLRHGIRPDFFEIHLLLEWLIHQKYPVRKDTISVHLSYYTVYFAVTKDCTFFSLIK